jgi:hypothetical protein
MLLIDYTVFWTEQEIFPFGLGPNRLVISALAMTFAMDS